MRRQLGLVLFTAVMITMLSLSGCGGGGGDNYVPEPETGTIIGRVVQADAVNTGVGNAEVSIAAINLAGTQAAQTISAVTDADGNYVLRQVPVGTVNVIAGRSSDTTYRAQTIPQVPIRSNESTRLNIALLRTTDPEPTSLQLSPSAVVVDLNGQVKFAAKTGNSGSTPTFLIIGTIGTVGANGLFTGTQTGQGELRAYAGSVTASATIEVTPPRAPEISSFLPSPTEFGASGGTLNITAAANDGDGIVSLVAEIYPPGSDVITVPLTLQAGSAKDGTYRGSYALPANINTPNNQGVQAPIKYSVRLVVTDGTSAVTASGFVDVVVKGLLAPPPPI